MNYHSYLDMNLFFICHPDINTKERKYLTRHVAMLHVVNDTVNCVEKRCAGAGGKARPI